MLEPLTPAHAPALRDASRDAEVWRWTSVDVGSDDESFERWLAAALAAAAAGDEVPFATIERRTGRIVGSTRYLTLRPEHRGLEIGHTWLASALWGTGVNVEAKLLMLGHAFDRLGCMRVEFKTDARNERSRGALAALPAQFEGIFRRHMIVRDGEARDSAYYSVIDDEWPHVRSLLERRLAARIASAP